jgi:hypothetical protein
MGSVVVDISMSLDGFVTGPGADPEHGLGIGGELIHGWVEASGESPTRPTSFTASCSMKRATIGRR